MTSDEVERRFQRDAAREAMKSRTRRKNLFSAVTPSKIPDMVYKQLVSLITRGHLKPGEKLPSERAMALELGVSRQSIREAIYRATTAGLMEVRQGEGTFIISSFKGNLRQPLSILLDGAGGKGFRVPGNPQTHRRMVCGKSLRGSDTGGSQKDAGNPEENGEGEAC